MPRSLLRFTLVFLALTVVISCGALKTIDVIVPVEDVVKVPVVSSTPHGLWHGVKLLGVPARVQGFGMVMAKG